MNVAINDRYVIVLDDDPTVAPLIEKILGMECLSFVSNEALMSVVTKYRPTALFVDIHLSETSQGLEIVPRLRKRWPLCPIIVVTADPSETAVQEALSTGADDFILKPIRPVELLARYQARTADLMKRAGKTTLRVADITIDSIHRQVRGHGVQRTLSQTSLNALITIVQAKGSVVSRAALKRKVWGEFAVSDGALDRKIFEVRKVLQEVSQVLRLKVRYGTGFYLSSQVQNKELLTPNVEEDIL